MFSEFFVCMWWVEQITFLVNSFCRDSLRNLEIIGDDEINQIRGLVTWLSNACLRADEKFFCSGALQTEDTAF